MAVQGSMGAYISMNQTGSADLGSLYWEYVTSWIIAFTSGTGVNQVNKIYQNSDTLAGSGATTYDLDAGTMLDPQNGTLTFSRIAVIAMRRTDTPAASTQDENLTIGGDFILTKLLAGWTDDALTIPVRPGGIFLYIAPDATGVAVTASTGDAITITNASSADSCTYQIIIAGS